MLWHQQYIRSAAELCQWDVIAEYAQQADNCSLQMDALWRLPSWDRLKHDVLPRAQVPAPPPLRQYGSNVPSVIRSRLTSCSKVQLSYLVLSSNGTVVSCGFRAGSTQRGLVCLSE